MKDMDIEEIKKLLDIIRPAPLIRVGHFSDHGESLSRAISEYCGTHDHDYILNCTDKEYFDKMSSIYGDRENCCIKDFKLVRPNYMLQGKFYDYLFVSLQNIADEDKEAFVQKCHKVIKNAGLILIFLPKSDSVQSDIWRRLLDENYYVATNTIDIDEEWSVIVSKKMHGWGG